MTVRQTCCRFGASRSVFGFAVVAVTAVAILAGWPAHAASPLSGRDSDPVVMNGSQLPSFTGLAPESVVGFCYHKGWTQIPIQIDECAVNDFGVVYDSIPLGVTTLGYTDAGTFMGSDPDDGFDDDDELVFMARDTGERAAWSAPDPAGVVPGTRIEVLISDPNTSDSGYIYLFETDGSLHPGAGLDYVTYNFVLLSGPYLTTYNTLSGPNPENSEVITPAYRTHFSDRWIRDELNIFTGGATGVEILDRHKNLFAPGNCGRSENTFSAGEGAFFANIDGPVRAIRSYIGANSGPFTQRDHFFYADRHDVVTRLRVHAISSVMDFYDYSPAALGMIYYNDFNTAGVDIDGSPVETVTPGAINWEMVTGAQGTLVHIGVLDTDIPGLGYTSYYLDDATPPVTQCTGDDHAYGSSGLYVDQPIPNTDPGLGPAYRFVMTRTVYVEAPNQPVSTATTRHAQVALPLTTTVSPVTAAHSPGVSPPLLLGQNFPNPFSRTTRFVVTAPPGESFTVRIFDVGGKLVKTLIDKAHGQRIIGWDGRDKNGLRVASGIYFYQFTSKQFTQTRKMVLVD
ncbi:MAG: T9SS type A sorting domain-containing protein [Candidatus Latescibacterota bacterium]|nr:MAG: T9SS type A sorting domain-containing protein [Candidatus Latescibacterota bacterium]